MQLPVATINPDTKITLQRMLPIPGEVLVQTGQQVTALNPVARAEIPSRYRVIDVARQLGWPQVDMDEVMLAAAGDTVQANQVIAAIKGGLPFLQRSVRAPADGRIVTLGPGWVVLETERAATEIQAFVDGVVKRVVPNRGVIIETEGTLIEAPGGFGGEAHGRLKRLVDSPYDLLETNLIDESAAESIILGGQTVDEEILRRAEECQVRGIIVGGISTTLLHLVDPPVKVRVVATEGFGRIPISAYTFGILSRLTNREVSIRGQLPAFIKKVRGQAEEGSVIIFSHTSKMSNNPTDVRSEAEVGSRVRLIRGRLLGINGTINSIPPEPQATEAGIIALGANIKINNEIHFIPWANLELIENK